MEFELEGSLYERVMVSTHITDPTSCDGCAFNTNPGCEALFKREVPPCWEGSKYHPGGVVLYIFREKTQV